MTSGGRARNLIPQTTRFFFNLYLLNSYGNQIMRACRCPMSIWQLEATGYGDVSYDLPALADVDCDSPTFS
jgi:hypothetical protein